MTNRGQASIVDVHEPAQPAVLKGAAGQVPGAKAVHEPKAGGLASWLPIPVDVLAISAGLLAMFVLTLVDLLSSDGKGVWVRDEQSHGPIVLIVALWLLVTRWRDSGIDRTQRPGQGFAWPLFALGGFLFVSGRALGIIYFEVGAFLPMLAASLLLMGGWPLLNKLKFPIFFMIFMIPLPEFILGPVSHFMKLRISILVADILGALGYPIAHQGVILQIGQYQLLVADACAGMRTLFMLEALGILYLNVVQHTSALRNVALACLIVPISFTANTIRVIVLTLITYYFGDEAGQGFLHGFAGMVLFLCGLGLTIALDGLMRLISARLHPQQA